MDEIVAATELRNHIYIFYRSGKIVQMSIDWTTGDIHFRVLTIEAPKL